MSVWNYIGEFLLFRWLFGKFKKSATVHDTRTEGFGTSIDRGSECMNVNHDEDMAPIIDDADTPVGDNLIDDSNNSEDLDDLDIFMRDNNGNNHSDRHHGVYDSDYLSSSRNSGYHDWNFGCYDQSYDDFHYEQDDYDMMDDDF